MSKIARFTQKIFGINAGTDQIAQIGSLNAGTPVYSTNPATLQALSNYLAGWFSVVIGSNSPAIEDDNALNYVMTSQLAYLTQAGIAEWDSGTTYYIGSFASDGVGGFYVSLTDNNLNNALTSTSNWRWVTAGANNVSINPSVSSPYTLTSADSGKTFLVNSANAAMTFTLPAAILNFTFFVKDSGGSASTNNITIARHASESIEGLAANYLGTVDYGVWKFSCDGTNYWIED